ncbi:long-chain fatty acid--CoA ligase [Gordonia sp. TBRC 11910]|uniref:Long-chain fatty acid--CoA ligase n=1 Tax=Gordonia asplenii TaxID=2725283 RepID=A0A848KSK2_9ACTN|nr:AMP-binding protein [Gordonia asplenii]NMN99854.1 long-chain fatty acid--CoA ligase [Gordonia asplenii]
MTSLVAPIITHAETTPDHEALRGPAGSLTYAQLVGEVKAYAGMLAARGVAPGDRILFIGPTLPEFVVGYLGIHAAGAIVVPVNPLCTPAELSYFIDDAGCRLAIAWESLASAARTAASEKGIDFLTLSAGATADADAITDVHDFDDADIAMLLYTSGTTGRPKGAELTTGNLTAAARISGQLSQSTADDRVGTGLPLFHVFGQAAVMLSGLHSGATVSLLPMFTPTSMIDLIVKDQLTIVCGVPTMWNAMLHAPDDTPADAFNHLRLAVSGGASLPLEVSNAFKRRFGCDISEGYGLTETAALGTFSRPGTPSPIGTVGPAVPEVDVEVRGSDGQPVPTGERGEVFIRGPIVMRGYWNRPDATAETIDADGWLSTGDIGEFDEAGNLRIVDRAKELIIRGGYNVYPSEVENALYEHPDIVEVAVVGVPDEHYGEEIAAVIATTPGVTLDAAAVRDWANDRLASYKLPRAVHFVDALPKGPSGKILKRAIDPEPLLAAVVEYRAARNG